MRFYFSKLNVSKEKIGEILKNNKNIPNEKLMEVILKEKNLYLKNIDSNENLILLKNTEMMEIFNESKRTRFNVKLTNDYLELMTYIPLHITSNNTNEFSTLSVDDIFKMEYQEAAIDNNNFNRRGKSIGKKNNNLKIITGNTFFLGITEKTKRPIILLAKNNEGYENLSKLRGKINITKEDLKSHSNGLIALSGGISSELHYLYVNNSYKLNELIRFFKSTFNEDFYVEYNKKMKLNLEIFKLRFKADNVKVIASDEILYKNRCKKNLNSNEYMFSDNYKDNNKEFNLHSQSDMEDIYKEHMSLLYNTLEINDKCQGVTLGYKLNTSGEFLDNLKISLKDEAKMIRKEAEEQYNQEKNKAKKEFIFKEAMEKKEELDSFIKDIDNIYNSELKDYFDIVFMILDYCKINKFVYTLKGDLLKYNLIRKQLKLSYIEETLLGIDENFLEKLSMGEYFEISLDIAPNNRDELIKYIKNSIPNCEIYRFNTTDKNLDNSLYICSKKLEIPYTLAQGSCCIGKVIEEKCSVIKGTKGILLNIKPNEYLWAKEIYDENLNLQQLKKTILTINSNNLRGLPNLQKLSPQNIDYVTKCLKKFISKDNFSEGIFLEKDSEKLKIKKLIKAIVTRLTETLIVLNYGNENAIDEHLKLINQCDLKSFKEDKTTYNEKKIKTKATNKKSAKKTDEPKVDESMDIDLNLLVHSSNDEYRDDDIDFSALIGVDLDFCSREQILSALINEGKCISGKITQFNNLENIINDAYITFICMHALNSDMDQYYKNIFSYCSKKEANNILTDIRLNEEISNIDHIYKLALDSMLDSPAKLNSKLSILEGISDKKNVENTNRKEINESFLKGLDLIEKINKNLEMYEDIPIKPIGIVKELKEDVLKKSGAKMIKFELQDFKNSYHKIPAVVFEYNLKVAEDLKDGDKVIVKGKLKKGFKGSSITVSDIIKIEKLKVFNKIIIKKYSEALLDEISRFHSLETNENTIPVVVQNKENELLRIKYSYILEEVLSKYKDQIEFK